MLHLSKVEHLKIESVDRFQNFNKLYDAASKLVTEGDLSEPTFPRSKRSKKPSTG
jgi:hypothetical protein